MKVFAIIFLFFVGVFTIGASVFVLTKINKSMRSVEAMLICEYEMQEKLEEVNYGEYLCRHMEQTLSKEDICAANDPDYEGVEKKYQYDLMRCAEKKMQLF